MADSRGVHSDSRVLPVVGNPRFSLQSMGVPDGCAGGDEADRPLPF
jgi:hypothetical protein